MSAPTVSLPRRDAEELRRLVERAITIADRMEQAGKPVDTASYRRLVQLYGALDRALTPHQSTPIRQIGGSPR